MNAIALLEEDHDRIRKLLKEAGRKESVQERRSTFDVLARELRAHEKIEEEILYPALKQHPRTREMTLEGYEEHHLINPLIDELEVIAPSDERWPAKLKVLTETLEHHIKEEEDQLFPKAKRVLDEKDLDRMGTRVKEMKSAGLHA